MRALTPRVDDAIKKRTLGGEDADHASPSDVSAVMDCVKTDQGCLIREECPAPPGSKVRMISFGWTSPNVRVDEPSPQDRGSRPSRYRPGCVLVGDVDVKVVVANDLE